MLHTNSFRKLNFTHTRHLQQFLTISLQVRKILSMFRGHLKNRQLYKLLSKVNSKQRALSLFMALYFRLDFFLTFIGWTKSRCEAGHRILQGHIYLNGRISRRRNQKLCYNDIISLDTKEVVYSKFRYMQRLVRSLRRDRDNRFLNNYRLRLFSLRSLWSYSRFLVHPILGNSSLLLKYPVDQTNNRRDFCVSWKNRLVFQLESHLYMFREKCVILSSQSSENTSSLWAGRYRQRLSWYRRMLRLYRWIHPDIKVIGRPRLKRRIRHRIRLHHFWQYKRFASYLNYNFRTFTVHICLEPHLVSLQHFSQFSLDDVEQLAFIL